MKMHDPCVRTCLPEVDEALIELSSRSRSSTPYCLHASGAEARRGRGRHVRALHVRTYVRTYNYKKATVGALM